MIENKDCYSVEQPLIYRMNLPVKLIFSGGVVGSKETPDIPYYFHQGYPAIPLAFLPLFFVISSHLHSLLLAIDTVDIGYWHCYSILLTTSKNQKLLAPEPAKAQKPFKKYG